LLIIDYLNPRMDSKEKDWSPWKRMHRRDKWCSEVVLDAIGVTSRASWILGPARIVEPDVIEVGSGMNVAHNLFIECLC